MSIFFDPEKFRPDSIVGMILQALGWAVLFASGVYLVVQGVDAFETLYAHSRSLEHLELDEMLLALMAFMVVFPALLVAIMIRKNNKLVRTNRALAETAQALDEARQEATKAQQVKECFLHHIHHELRTPLNAIVGFTEVIDQEMFGPIANDAYKRYLRDIRDSSVQLHHILTQVLEITAIESGGVELNDGPAKVADLVSGAIAKIRPAAEKRNVNVVNQVNDAHPMVLIEVPRMRQALAGILENAVQACDEGGVVTVSVDHDTGGHMVLEVTDTGIGMHPDEVQRATVPFEQIHREQLGRHVGGGLGLPLSLGQVRLHGGDVDIQSLPGKGTTVRVRLPKERVMLGEMGAD